MKDKLFIGVIGYSSENFDTKLARAFLEKVIGMFDSDITIVAGLTNVGTNAVAYSVAQSQGLKTVGVACSRAKEHDIFPVDKSVIVGNEWGDESEKFVEMADIIVKIGGGDQSAKEAQMARSLGKAVIELPLPVIS